MDAAGPFRVAESETIMRCAMQSLRQDRECGHPCHLLSCNFCRLRDDFDDGQLDSIALEARSNPTARRRRNHLEVCKSCMTKVTRVSTFSMGQSIPRLTSFDLRHENFRETVDMNSTLTGS